MSIRHHIAAVAVAVAAAGTLFWALATLWFHYPKLPTAYAQVNALILIALWAIGPAVWFLVEWRVWKTEPELQLGQQYARDFWLGTGAIVLLLAAHELGRDAVAKRGEYDVAWNLVVEVIRILAWPLLVFAGTLVFREPIAEFFRALGSRASKIGVLNVSVELAALPEAQPWQGPLIDDLKAEYPTAAGDSSGSLFRAVADTAHADYITVDLEDGEAWLTSRLFILAAVISRVRSIKQIVFLAGPARQYTGNASPNAVAAALARRFPWLEDAYLSAHAYCAGTAVQRTGTLFGGLEPDHAGTIVGNYLQAVRGQGVGDEWVNLGSYIEHAEWLNVATLEQYLGTDLDTSAVRRDPSVDAVVLGKTLLRHDSPYVAVLDSRGRFAHLIDRYRSVDEVLRRELR